MSGRGPSPKPHTQRIRDEKRRARGSFRQSESIGWQHGLVPNPPDGIFAATQDAWQTWFRSWVAAHWTPLDLPAIRQLARLYDAVERNQLARAPELRYWLDTYGLTPKGQQDRRWVPPEQTAPPRRRRARSTTDDDPYAHLRAVGADE